MAEDRPQQRKPSGTPDAELLTEELAARVERLKAMQWESLGSSRRDYLSTTGDDRGSTILETLETTRLVNLPGTEEWNAAREKQADLSKWNNAWQNLHDDGTAEEDLEDIAGGQTHRTKLAEAEALAREGGNPYQDTKSGRRGGHGTARAARARGGGVIGTRGRGDRRRDAAREPAHRSSTAILEPLATQDARNRTTGRDEGYREKRGKTLTPLSTTIGSSSRGRAASKQTARGSVVSISGRGRPQISTSRQISTRSQRPSTSDYEDFLAPPETFMATYQSRVVDRQPTTAEAVNLPDALASTTASDAPKIDSQEVVEHNTAAGGEGNATGRSSVHFTTFNGSEISATDPIVVFSPEIDSAPVGVRIPTPPPSGVTTSVPSRQGSYLDDLVGLEWREEAPTTSPEAAMKPPGVASEDGEILDESRPDNKTETTDRVTVSSNAWSQLALLLPTLSRALDPSVVAQLEALVARGLMQLRTAGPGSQTTSSASTSSDRASIEPASTSTATLGLSDSRSAQPAASSNRVSAGQSTGHVEGLRTAWTRNVEAGDYEAVKDNPIIFGEQIFRSASTRKSSTTKATEPIASGTAISNPSLPSANLGIESSRVTSSTRAQGAKLPIASEDRSSRDKLSLHSPATHEEDAEGATESKFLGSPPLEGNLTRSAYALGGYAHPPTFTNRSHIKDTSGSGDIIGEHLLPNLQRHNFEEDRSHGVRASYTATHARFNSPAAHTRFGSPATHDLVPATDIASTASLPLEPPTLELARLSLETNRLDVAADRHMIEEGSVARPNIIVRSNPQIPMSAATSQYGSPTQTSPSPGPVSKGPREGAVMHTSSRPIKGSNVTSRWEQVGAQPTASTSLPHGGSAVASTSSTGFSYVGRGRDGHLRQPAPQLPAFLADNPAPSSDLGAAAARQYGLDSPRSPLALQPTRQLRQRGDFASGDSMDLQASVSAAPYTGAPSLNRPTIYNSEFLKQSDDAESYESSRGLKPKKDPWDTLRKYGS